MELDKNAGQDPGASRVSAQPAQWREWLALRSVRGVGNVTYRMLLEHFDSPQAVFQPILTYHLRPLAQTKGFRIALVKALHDVRVQQGGQALTHTELVRRAAALHLLHEASLIIDDVLDHDVVRRGQRTVHCLFGHIPATDAAGKLCTQVAGSGEVMRFKPDGTVDRRINIPAKTITSVAFGGPDICDLYIVTANNDQRDLKGTVFRSRSEIPGLPVPKAKF